jgi:tetratricopeptide (TPR) repeat protein
MDYREEIYREAEHDALEAMFSASQGAARFELGLQLADRLILRSAYPQALSVLEDIRQLAPDQNRAALISQKLGRIYLRLSRYDQAYHHLGEALSCLGANPDSLELFMVYHDLAWMFYRQGQLAKARSYLEGAELVVDLRSDREPGIEEARADLLHVSALIEAASANNDLALTLLDDERQIRQRLGDKARLAAVYNKISGVHQAKGDMVRALGYQEQTLKMALECGDRFRQAVSLKNLAEIFHSLGDMDKAEDCCQRSLELSRDVGNRLGEAFALAGLGRLHTSRGQYPEAEEQLLAALNISRQVNSRQRESSILADLADLYCQWGKPDLATKQLDAAETINNERDQFLSARHQVVAAKVLYHTAKAQTLSQARIILEGLVAHPIMIDDEESLSSTELEIEANLLLSQVLAKLGFKGRAQIAAAKAQSLTAAFSYNFDPETKEKYFAKPEVRRVFEWSRELG